jgi:hypothetical protein
MIRIATPSQPELPKFIKNMAPIVIPDAPVPCPQTPWSLAPHVGI